MEAWSHSIDGVREFLANIAPTFRDFLGVNLAGVYLHGSLATGSYHRAKSDIDLLLVVNKSLDEEQRRRFALLCVSLSDTRPTLGDIELSVILRKNAQRFIHPLPYEVHYSPVHRDKILGEKEDYSRDRTDRDLAAHCAVVRARGVRLDGAPIHEVFGEVPFKDYLDAIFYDLNWIVEGDNIIESPYYSVLNICRVLKVLDRGEGTIPSKEEGASWALDNLPSEHHELIVQALRTYQSDKPVTEADRKTGGVHWDERALRSFTDYARRAATKHGNESHRYPNGELKGSAFYTGRVRRHDSNPHAADYLHRTGRLAERVLGKPAERFDGPSR